MKIKIQRHTVVVGMSAVVLALLFQNCGQAGNIVTSASPVTSAQGSPDITPGTSLQYQITKIPSSKYICEPFGTPPAGTQAQSGLKAQLAYIDPTFGLTATVKNAYSVLSYFQNKDPFVSIDVSIYLSQINVPTRQFDQGFKLSDGSYLSDLKGNKLIEYFGLKMSSVLKLSDTDADGEYELATISDDGSILYLTIDNQKVELINNDQAHSTKMKCATKTIALDHNSRIPLSYFYNQGPRTEISNVLVWRYVGPKASSSAIATPYKLCDKADSNLFWSPANSAEGTYVTQIKADGYKVVAPANFELPDSQINPCAAQTANQIVSADFSGTTSSSSKLNIVFSSMNLITAQLFKVVGGESILLKKYLASAELKDRLMLELSALQPDSEYRIEFTIENPALATRITNEIRFNLSAIVSSSDQ